MKRWFLVDDFIISYVFIILITIKNYIIFGFFHKDSINISDFNSDHENIKKVGVLMNNYYIDNISLISSILLNEDNISRIYYTKINAKSFNSYDLNLYTERKKQTIEFLPIIKTSIIISICLRIKTGKKIMKEVNKEIINAKT